MRLMTVVVLAAIAGAGWHYREPLMTMAGHPPAMSDVPEVLGGAEPAHDRNAVYRWVDERGMTHFGPLSEAGPGAVLVEQREVQTYSAPRQEEEPGKNTAGNNGQQRSSGAPRAMGLTGVASPDDLSAQP